MNEIFFSSRAKKIKRTTSVHTEKLTDRQNQILDLFGKKRNLQFRVIYNSFSDKISERTLRYELAQLKEKGFLTTKGRGPSTVWEKKQQKD